MTGQLGYGQKINRYQPKRKPHRKKDPYNKINYANI